MCTNAYVVRYIYYTQFVVIGIEKKTQIDRQTDIHTYMYVQINSHQQFECVWVAFTRTHIICYLAGMFFIKHTQQKEFIPAFTGCVLFQPPAALAILFHILHTNSQLLTVRFSNSSLHPTT